MNIIVADDEKWVRNTITSIIPYDKLGLTLVSEAGNGLEALELCRQYKPDILVTDLMMPGLTGMELIQELKTVLPDLKIIIISGYSDFEYAKTAIKYGVSEYLLKPVDEVELCNVLSKVRVEILERRRRLDEENALRHRYKRALPIICSGYLNQLILPNSFLTDSINKTLVGYGISFPHPFFTIVVFSPDDISALLDSNNANTYKTFVRRVMKKYLGGIAFPRSSNEYELTSIINHRQANDRDLFLKALHLCISLYRKHFSNTLSIGISSSTQQVTKLPDLYAEASEALDVRFWKTGPKIFTYQENRIIPFQGIKVPEQIIENILLGIKLQDIQPANSLVNEICSSLKTTHQYSRPAPIKEFFWAFIQTIISSLNMQLSFIDYETMVTNTHPYEKMKSINSLEHLMEYVREMVQHISEHYYNKNCGNDPGNVVATAKKIINQNYQRDISLELIAQYVHLSSTYFSELFKRETGMSFIDYKTLLRVENAKKLLSSSNINVYEISSRIGYSNSKYFSRLFKKITGMTPYEYKEKYGQTGSPIHQPIEL